MREQITILCSHSSFAAKAGIQPPSPGLWMPDRVRHDESAITRLKPIAKRSNHRMSTLTYKDQSAAELRLHLLADRVDFQHFGPLATVRLEQPQFQVQASIIGTSHIVHIAYDNTQYVSEILACTDIPPALQPTFSDWIVNLTHPVDLQLTAGAALSFCSPADGQPARPARLSGIGPAYCPGWYRHGALIKHWPGLFFSRHPPRPGSPNAGLGNARQAKPARDSQNRPQLPE